MLLALAAAAAALVAVLTEVLGPRVIRYLRSRRETPRLTEPATFQDPGRELRAENKARALLRSCVNAEDWEMYRELGFLRVWSRAPEDGEHQRCAYLIYPHQPIVAYLPAAGRLVAEYCVNFEDPSTPYGSGRLPPSDDVLAKWMALTGDEQRLVDRANMHLPGRQVKLAQVERDLVRLAQWEGDRARRAGTAEPAMDASASRTAVSFPATPPRPS